MRAWSVTVLIVSAMLIQTTSWKVCAASRVVPSLESCHHHEDWWSANERLLWLSVCRGDSHVFGGTKPAPGPTLTKISGRFLEALFTKKPYSDSLTHSPVEFNNLEITSPIRLTSVNIEGLRFKNSDFDDIVDLSDSHFSGSLSFIGTSFLHGLCARRILVAGSIILGAVDMDAAHADQTPVKRVKIGNLLNTCSSTDRAVPSIDANTSSIGGGLFIRGAVLSGPIALSGIHVAGELDMEGVQGHEVWLSSATVSGQVVIVDSEFSTTGAREGGDEPTLLNLFELHTAKSVFLNRSTFDADIYAEESNIEGSLYMTGASLSRISLRNATIGEALSFGANYHKGMSTTVTRWSKTAVLDLSHAKINEIFAPRNFDYWPNNINFTDFTVTSFVSGNIKMPDRSVDEASWFPQWLSHSSEKKYSPQPYQTVISLLNNEGSPSAAAAVGYAGKEREREEACESWKIDDCLYLWLARMLIGYGYKIWLSIGWSALLVIVGALVFQQTPESKLYHMPFGFSYSFDMLLPIIKLRELHYKIELAGPTRYYFYFHKLAGWVLGSFIVAAVSGITK
ncbi:pentapeptide repeat-containing protein [Burkholderia pseudomallei]|uniref:pentapeptide repeat-containing protein n=1 Tax=Burkholderia pseudomallei TaxID=28450 RepID=UPI0005E0A927|nr:pentapeptide repeat-containing protein [Burkholderia pseudomallei]CAJ3333936.1 Uncharacterised protein [Burkholderia pseudomallei]CAJ3866071.1 Uncharacterised protein [Burkholderia pseudomallei]CAJ3895924.1 Uncharacterised protein [Burkholderia pseudomallei]CAJ5632931.1 Uncharacterised protein [Burkholderia pseudomallei]CAJ7001682.1 Uncharacterised protein [Burkholderia pseudomallei]